jgi:Fur family ferric uptake transcriptional regulator
VIAFVPRVSISDPAKRAKWRKALRDAGLKCTEQRLAVLHELELAEVPMSHREMHERLAHFQWDPATTFRNLNDLCEGQLVARIDVGDHVWRFELRPRATQRPGHHPHFLCVSCGAITCLHEVSVVDAARRLTRSGSAAVVEEVLLKGRCADCS